MKHFDIRRWIAGALLATAALLTPTGVHAQQGPKPRLNPAMVAKNPYSKLVRDLVKLEQAYKTYESQPNARKGPFTPPNRLFQIREGKYVVVDAVAENGAPALKNDLAALGAKGIVSYGRVVSCQVPLNRISQLQNLRSMRFARPAYASNNVGLVTSGGDSAQRSGLARRQFGLNGKGIKVGALSDSYNQLIGERGSVITGDLPGPENPNGYKKPVQVLEDIDPSELATIDEGRAMLEIIHDVVPGAELAFHTAFQGQAGFANGIIALKDSGCNVIVDDVFYYGEPYFQEGIIAQAVNQVAKEGVAYFSSAGNQARDSYQKAFQPSGRNFLGGEAHNFAPGDPFLRFFVPAGGETIVILQWSDPFFSVSGKGASTDLNLYLVNDSLNRVLFASDFPSLGEDPFEGFVLTNDGPTGTFYNLLIEKASGPDPELIKVIGYNSFVPVEHWTSSSTVVGHPNAAGAIAVGAARYDQTPAFGRDTTRLEPYSSAGGTPILFDENGNKIPAVVRRKPEITGPDGVNTTFFIPRIDLEGDGFPNFFGTSASAPHAAAVAALMLEANKALQPGQVRQVLQETALDMDDPYTRGTFDEGFDFGTGYGLIRADRAVESVLGTPLVQRFVLVNADNGEDLDEIREGDVVNLATLPTRNLNIRAETAPAKVGSVVFDLNGKETTENLAPYALAGDFANTPVKYRILTPALSPGNYALSAVPYADDNGEGDAGLALTVNFRVVESAVTSFVLVDADTGEEVMQIEDQSVIFLVDLPERVNIRANTVPAKVGSVVFEYNEYQSQFPGLRVVENLPPYALGGDFYEQPARYRSLADTLVDEGIYSLLATPYAKADGKGAAGQPLRVLFLLSADTAFAATPPATDVAVNNAPKPANAQPVVAAGTAAARPLGVYPNPTTGKLRVQTAKGGTLVLYNAKGDRVYRAKAVDASAQVDLSTLPDGLYLLRVEEDSATRTIRVVKRGE